MLSLLGLYEKCDVALGYGASLHAVIGSEYFAWSRSWRKDETVPVFFGMQQLLEFN